MTSLENDLADKEDRLRAAVATRQEFAGQLVAAQQRELSVIAANAELAKTQVSILTYVPTLFIDKIYNMK